MTALLIWKALAAIAATPSAAIVARAIARRLTRLWKDHVSEIDYLRAEIKNERKEHAEEVDYLRAELRREREEAAADLRDAIAVREERIDRLDLRVETLENVRDSLTADLKVAQFDLETARKFVDSATSAATTRKEGTRR